MARGTLLNAGSLVYLSVLNFGEESGEHMMIPSGMLMQECF